MGRREAQLEHRVARAADRGGDRAPRLVAPARGVTSEVRDRLRPDRRQPAVRRRVRTHAERAGRPRDAEPSRVSRSGRDRPTACRRSSPPGSTRSRSSRSSSCRTRRSSGRCSGPARWRRWAEPMPNRSGRSCTSSFARSSFDGRGSPPWSMRPSTRSRTRSSVTWRTVRSRAFRVRASTSRRRSGWSDSRVSGSPITPSCSLTTTGRRWSSRGPLDARIRSRRSRSPRGARGCCRGAGDGPRRLAGGSVLHQRT